MNDDLRQCKYCKEWKPSSEFPKHKNNKDGIDKRCRACIKIRSKIVEDLRKNCPSKPEDGKCQARGCTHTKSLVLDHDPITGKFRGWICENCNIGLGHLGDSVEEVKKMVVYLERAS